MTFAQLADLPVVVDLVTAAAALRIGRSTAYQLASDGNFPVPLITVGRGYRVATAELVDLLGANQIVADLSTQGGDTDAIVSDR